MAIKAEIGLEITEFERNIRRVEDLSKRTGASLKAFGDSMSKIVTGPLLAIGAGLFAASIQSANFADEIDKASIRSGVSRERLQELRFVTDQVGVSFQAIETAADALRRRLPQLENPTSAASVTLQRLGVSATDASGELRDMDALLPDIIRGLSEVENATERGALATQILGRSASQLAPLLEQGEAGIEQLTARAHQLGLVMGDEAISELVEFKDMMAEVQQEVGAVGREFGMFLLPIIRDDLIPFMQNTAIPVLRNIADRFNSLDDSTRRNILVFGGLVAAIGPAVSITGRLLTNITPLIGAFRSLTLVMMANPYIAVGAAILALGTYMASTVIQARRLRQETDAIRSGEQQLQGTTEERIRLGERLVAINRQLAREGQVGGIGRDTAIALREERDEIRERIRESANLQGARIVEERQMQAEADRLRELAAQNRAYAGELDNVTGRMRELRQQRSALVDEIIDDELGDIDFDFTFGEGDIEDIQERFSAGLGVSIAEVNQALNALNEAYDQTTSPENRAELAALIEEFENLRDTLEVSNNDLEQHNDRLIYHYGIIDGALMNAIQNIDLFRDGWEDVGTTVKRVIQQIINDLARMAAMRGFQALLGISTGGAGLGFGAIFGGFRAMGGDVSRGRSYVVGEDGPEIFTPNQSGMIIPNGAMAGAGMRPVGISGGGAMRLTGKFRIEGRDLVYVINEYNNEVDFG